MKIGVSSYSFTQLLQAGLHTQFSIISLAASLGFDGIEFTDLTPPEGTTEEKYALLLKAEAARCGLSVISHTVAANLLSPDPETEIKRLYHKIDIAQLLGAPLLRHDAYFSFPENAPKDASFEYYLPQITKLFRQITDYAQSKGIKTCTENHGFICQDPNRVEAIIKGVASPNFGWLVDIGHFLCADCAPLPSVKTAAPYAFHVHVKDFYLWDTAQEGTFISRGGKYLKGATLGEGIVPVQDCLQTLFSAGYNSFVSVEFEGSEPVIPALEKSIKLLRTIKL